MSSRKYCFQRGSFDQDVCFCRWLEFGKSAPIGRCGKCSPAGEKEGKKPFQACHTPYSRCFRPLYSRTQNFLQNQWRQFPLQHIEYVIICLRFLETPGASLVINPTFIAIRFVNHKLAQLYWFESLRNLLLSCRFHRPYDLIVAEPKLDLTLNPDGDLRLEALLESWKVLQKTPSLGIWPEETPAAEPGPSTPAAGAQTASQKPQTTGPKSGKTRPALEAGPSAPLRFTAEGRVQSCQVYVVDGVAQVQEEIRWVNP